MESEEMEFNATIALRPAHASALVAGLESLRGVDVAEVGGKAAALGELFSAGANVPPGIAITTSAFKSFLSDNNLAGRIRDSLSELDVEDDESLRRVSDHLKQLIVSAKIGPELRSKIAAEYETRGLGAVAVRSSATVEDSADASFAGQQETFLNVLGIDAVLEAVLGCWASLFEARALFYRKSQGVTEAEFLTGVVVQSMVPASHSGVMFTVDPTSADRNRVLVEAIFGLGELLVAGEITPDAYFIDGRTGEIFSRQVAIQDQALVMSANPSRFDRGTHLVEVEDRRRGEQKLSDHQIELIAQIGIRLQDYFGRPQDVEWAISGDQIFILQSRPLTALVEQDSSDSFAKLQAEPLVTGVTACPGLVAGAPRIIRDVSEVALVRPGEILVTAMTTPDFVPAMKRAAAIVTDRGGRACHAAIVSREMGVPCIVGAGDATTRLAEVPLVTVHASSGSVYAGDLVGCFDETNGDDEGWHEPLETETKVYVNVSDPDMAQAVSTRDSDGVGLLRAEFMISHLVGEHPAALLDSGRAHEFTRKLSEGLEKFATAFYPRPVVYRFSDFKTNEYRGLKGGARFEPHEENPMIGYRGCARYLASPELFEMEVKAVAKVRERWRNLWTMLPFVRTVDELAGVKRLLESGGLRRGTGFKLWMMVEVPSNVLILDDFISQGIDGVSIGSNDLTQLILGVDRDSERLVDLLDERNRAVMKALDHVVNTCRKRRVPVSICGQAPSIYPELTRQLVSWGITSISVTPDMLERTRAIVHEAETMARRNPEAPGQVAVSAD